MASEQRVWRLQPVELTAQVTQLVQDKQFELALNLAVSMNVHCSALCSHLYRKCHDGEGKAV